MVCDPESDEQFERILAFEPETQKALDYIQEKGYELEDVTIYGPQAYITKVSKDFEKEDAPFAKYFLRLSGEGVIYAKVYSRDH